MIEGTISKFEPIALEQTDEVKLMNRTDRKFFVNIRELPELLQSVQNDYYILEIKGRRLHSYSNIYFDDSRNSMFNDHLRGKKNRYKIRLRNYELSGISYLEVKNKTNKGKTVKSRIRCDVDRFDEAHNPVEFIKKHSPFRFEDLKPVLHNNFSRIMLVSKALNERCTVDLDIKFCFDGKKKSLNRIAVVEVKTEGYEKNTPMLQALRERHMRPSGFSKYCVGRSYLDNRLKKNAYKAKLREIDKMTVTS